WSRDSRALAFVIAFDGYPSEVILARWPGSDPVTVKLPRPDGESLHASVGGPMALKWRKGASGLCFLGDQKARVRLYCAGELDGGDPPAFRCLTPGDVAVDSFSLDASGDRAAVILGDPEHPQDVHLVEA